MDHAAPALPETSVDTFFAADIRVGRILSAAPDENGAVILLAVEREAPLGARVF